MSGQESNKSTPSIDITKIETPDWPYDKIYYVDKTLLIKKLFEVDHVFITAPPWFGKSRNMEMVRRFVEIEVDKDGKAIELDVDEDKRLSGDDFKEVLNELRYAINLVFKKHAYLQESSLWSSKGFDKETFIKYFDTEKSKLLTVEEIESALQLLSKYLYNYYGKAVYVFIEHLDKPLNSLVYKKRMASKDKRDAITLLQRVFKKLLKGNECVERSLLNACYQFGGLLLQSADNVHHYAFMQGHIFSEFYGLEEAEVMDLLKKLQRFEEFNEIKERYNGYKTTLRDGRHIQIYSPWHIVRHLQSEQLGWGYISRPIVDRIDHYKIRPKIAQLKSGKCVTIKYVKNYGVYDIKILSEFSCYNEINDNVVDLFIQFLYEDGILCLTDFGDDYLTLAIPNKAVHGLIDNILYFINLEKKYCDPHPFLIKKFIESLENVGRLCEENRVRDLADSIHVLFRNLIRKTNIPKNEYELSASLYIHMLQKFITVGAKRLTLIGTRCDTLLVIAYLNAAFMFEFNLINKKSNYTHRQIIDKRYDTLTEEALLKKKFSKHVWSLSIENRIYLGIHMDRDCKVSITYSLNNKDPNIVVSSGTLNEY
ncbi:hypothetical protein PV326_004081 [Microctonus aethiopoides]|nr:hypothetical protein PV326_004081 [Microctonus aethiopoides]